jgi:adenylosuccinate synthase
MSCTIVVGGQYGSEGKGKVVFLLSKHLSAPWIVRCGGPNSGHTTSFRGKDVVLRQVPAGADHPNALLLLSAGCAVDVDLLLAELEVLQISRERIVVDPRAVVVTEADRRAEAEGAAHIGSTSSGTGAALIRRMERSHETVLAADSEQLGERVRIEPVAPLLHAHLERRGDLIVEGTQGFGLSLLHGFEYPYVTARDTTAAGFASEVGLSPRHVDAITMVMRTYPIRVGGNSGPFPGEIDWEMVQAFSRAPAPYPELTSVTRRVRRVARFDMEAVTTACRYNRPTSLAVMGLDRFDYKNTKAKCTAELTAGTIEFLRSIEQQTSVPVDWVGTGFGTHDAFRRSAS